MPRGRDAVGPGSADEKFRALLEAAPDAILLVDDAGRIALVNGQAERLFGYDRQELLGQSIELLVPDRFRDRHPAHRGAYLRDPRPRPMGEGLELFGRRKDGSEFPVEISLSPVDSRDGRFVISAVRDVTRRRGDEARFRDLLESAPDAMVIVDGSGSIVLVNSQTERLFGWDRRELLGRPIEVLVPPRYRSRHVGLRDAFLAAPHVRPMGAGLELFGLRKDGTEVPVELSLSPLATAEGLLVSSSIRDVSDRRRAEAALAEKNVELEKASRAKDHFLATMSHELRTPLNAIIGFTGTLLMKLPGPLTTDQEKQLRTVQSSARHLLTLINDLLDLTKIESGKVEVCPEPVACGEVVQQVGAALRALAEGKGLRFETRVEEGVVVRADRRALSQILLNLVNNAIKFTDAGTVSLDVARRVEDGRRLVALAVADTGIGIRDEDRPRLFQAFSQLHRPGRRAEGTGLGLHLSARLAELMGGRITVRSAEGQGSAFTLLLAED